MSGGGVISAASYARKIERRWSEMLEQPVILSPRDWSVVSDWYERRIPLEIVEEAMEAAVERRRARGRRPRVGLSYLAPAVEESWRSLVAGRLGTPEQGPPATLLARETWRRRLAAEPGGSPLARLVAGLLARLDSGEPGPSVDAELDRRLPEVSDPALLREIETELDRDLLPHRGQIPADRLAATRRRARIDRLRLRLTLPRLEDRWP